VPRRPSSRKNHLERTDFTDATLWAARFRALNLQKTIGLTQAQVHQAFIIDCTLPDGPVAKNATPGAQDVDGQTQGETDG
jgi:hypothetical protein